MIKEAYCSYEISKFLKEKGFNWDCITYYVDSKPNDVKYSMLFENNTTWEERCCSASTHQMAMAWLRKKSIIIVIQPEYFNTESKCSTWGVDIWADDNYEKLQGDYPKYEKAVEVALKYCLGLI